MVRSRYGTSYPAFYSLRNSIDPVCYYSWSPKRIYAFTELRIYNFKQDEVRADSL
ncbi:hypothetical protein COLO4_03115 [Corchorus olitorius]|uniref:Uncharacterized protein n=1 Tax=Corchorus olitorius TaxID=93759 RepID=A0A1R3KZN1_9ROSI|nr:hypothetical protein COLO4_03115 [Corchorus olitorius]